MHRRELIKMLSGGAAGIPLVKSIERLSVSANDVIIVSCDRCLKPEAFEAIHLGFAECFPKTKVMILEGGLNVKVARTV